MHNILFTKLIFTLDGDKYTLIVYLSRQLLIVFLTSGVKADYEQVGMLM